MKSRGIYRDGLLVLSVITHRDQYVQNTGTLGFGNTESVDLVTEVVAMSFTPSTTKCIVGGAGHLSQ